MSCSPEVLSVGFINIRGQTGLTSAKQAQIESFLVKEKLDILHLQEINICDDSFNKCNVLSSSFNIISNNSPSKYGTASIIKSDFVAENINLDSNGRAIVFNIGPITLANLYLPSGTDSISRNSREQYFSETLPHLLLNRLDSGCIGGDMNCITNKLDCTHNPASKMSPSLSRLTKTFDMADCFRTLHPTSKVFSHYYHTTQLGAGATRIDRSYSWGDLKVVRASYEPIAFSDHMAYIVSFTLPSSTARILSPRSRPLFKIRPEVICDKLFQERLGDSMADWKEVKELGLDVLQWWEILVKPGIRKLAMQRSKELNREKRGELNLLLLRQAYLARKLQSGDLKLYAELRCVQVEIEAWYQKESEKVLLQSRSDEVCMNEKVRIFHHDLHKKHLKRSSILKLLTESGIVEGHDECAGYLENQVAELLLNPAPVDQTARNIMLGEVEEVFTEKDNESFLSIPAMSDVKEVLSNSNLLAAPGTDGIPSLLYSKCWDVMGPSLTEVVQSISKGGQPTLSMRTCLMVFGSKPKKPNSIKPGDKRRISLLNSDFKIVTGLEAHKFGKTATHTLSPVQLVAGSDRRIHHGINLARDTILQAGKNKIGCGLLDLDFMAGFDWLDMAWVYLVLARKGVSMTVIDRLKRLYTESTTVVVVNNVLGKAFPNNRGSLRQGDVPSMFWFAIGIDPLLVYLEKRLAGIPITNLPVLGPTLESAGSSTLPPIQQSYKVVAYADDVKPSITTMQEFFLVDEACAMLERASGVKLHRDPAAGKVKFLALGRWRGTLTQEDLPHQYIQLSDHLDFVGVELRATFVQTRKVNGDQLQTRVKNTIGPWKAGKFMPLTIRPYSANTYALSKVWFKCSTMNLRAQDISFINSQVKSWMYQDCLEKPSELVLYRSSEDGGLGLFNVKIRALALLIRTFLETSINPNFRHNLFHEILFRYHVQDEVSLPNPGLPPYYNMDFFEIIRHYHSNSPLNISVMTTRQWYRVLLEDQVLKTVPTDQSPSTLIPVRAETLHPGADWPRTWKLARTHGLGSDLTTFLFKLIHCLLPTQDRVSRLGVADGANPGLCQLCLLEVEDPAHAFFSCHKSMLAGLALLGYAQKNVPLLSPEAALRLEFGGTELPEQTDLATVCLLATGLRYIWEARQDKKQASIFKMRAEIEAMVSILRKTRHSKAGDQMMEMMK